MDQRGSILVVVIGISAVIATLVYSVMLSVDTRSHVASRARMILARDAIFMSVRHAVRSRAVIYQTLGYQGPGQPNLVAPIGQVPYLDPDGTPTDFAVYNLKPPVAVTAAFTNMSLLQCLVGDENPAPAPDCDTTQPPYPLTLVDVDGKTPLTAPLNAPVTSRAYYDVHGELCRTATASQCAFYVSTQFTAVCPNNLPQCGQARYLMVTIVVTPNPTATVGKADLAQLSPQTEIIQVNATDSTWPQIPLVPNIWPYCAYYPSNYRPGCARQPVTGTAGTANGSSSCPAGQIPLSSGCGTVNW